MAIAVQQQPDDNNSEGVWRRPEEQGTGRRRQPNNNNSEGVRRQPVDKGKQPGFSQSARESASITKGTLRELRVIGDCEARGESEGSKRAAEYLGRGRAQQVARTMSRGERGLKCAAECLGRGRAQQVAQTMSMEHHLRQVSKRKVSV